MKKTSWLKIWIVFFAGCVAAFQIGKTAASLSVIIAELDLGLVQAGYLASLFTLVGAIAGAGFGFLSDRLGHVKTAMAGLILSASGAFIGALAQDLSLLLLSRMIEGLGFIMAIVALPSLISRSADERSRPLAMGLWGAFMPAGIGASMLIAPGLIELHGWRGLWSDVGMIMLLVCAFLYLSFRGVKHHSGDSFAAADIVRSVLRGGPLLVVAGFICYSCLYVSVIMFFPTLLVTVKEVEYGAAAYLGALVAMANITGNISAGWLIGRGVAPWRLMQVSFLTMGICATAVFSSFSDPAIKTIAGILFSAFGGLFPGSAFVLASRYSIRPSHMAFMSGLLLQGAAIGQTIGPALVSNLVEYGGAWDYANIEIVGMAGIGLICALALRRFPEKNRP